MYMRKKRGLAMLATALFIFSACGQQEISDVPSQTEAVQTAVEDTYWTAERWIHNGGVGAVSKHSLYLTEIVGELDVEPGETYDGHTVEYCVLGNRIYGLVDFYRQEGDGWEHCYYISSYEGGNGEVKYQPIELPSPEEYGVFSFSVAAFDVKGPQELVLFLQGKQDRPLLPGCYLAVHMTPEGEILSATDLYPVLKKLDVNLSAIYDRACVDGAGYYYLIFGDAGFGEGTGVQVLGPDGETVGAMMPGEGYTGVEQAMKLPDGSAVFAWSSHEQSRTMLQIYDKEKKMPCTLLEENLIDIWLWAAGADGRLYYVDYFGDLTRCDIRTGLVEECLYYPQLGLDADRKSANRVGMVMGAGGEPEFLGSRDGETVICRLGTQPPGKGTIRLLSGSGFSTYIKDGAAAFSRKHPDCPVVLEYPEGDGETYWDRAMAQLVSGQGADMYYVSGSELRMLQEKGVLADLSELISGETLEELWPAALQSGTIDGQLVGVQLECWIESLLVSDEIWAEDHWTLKEALEVLEAHPEMQYPLVSYHEFDSAAVLSWLVLESLEYSPFLDLEKGTCDFANPLFIRALELAGTYTKAFDFDEASALYPEKDWVAMEIMVQIGNFEDYKSLLGEDYHIVGYPTEGESGTYWGGGGFLAVNREAVQNPERAEEIGLFLEELLSYDRQCSLFMTEPVRRDMLDNRLKPHYIGGEKGMYIEYGNGMMKMLTPGPKGDYRIGEFNAVMENLVARRVDTGDIENIILEEAGSYFSGDKDVAAVADIIQNRVQLYLNERQ